ncbi:MAG: PEGA domain-containing protein [Fibrobacteraceae bacterium]|jgi:hypothetical protein|nr:PEGA domain-containing protein [Fibrobacteraceae bacterium]MEE1067127.1 PEGA domain-containing protein [Fibrobacteraceae bacterium]
MNKQMLFSVLLVLFASLLCFAQDPPPRGQMGKVTIITDPPGSDVYLGNQELGKTPIVEKDFPSGRHTLVIIDQGYELVNERFNVWPNKVNEYGGKTTIPKGHLKITTKPAKCIIYVDGDQADMTDGAALTVRNLDAGDHMVRAECGRRSAEMLVTIKGEETSEITLDATKK